MLSAFLRRHEIQRARDVGLQVFAGHYGVEHSVFQQELAALEAFRQLLENGLLNYARTCKADERPRFGDIQVAEHGVRGGQSAGGRDGWLTEERNTGLMQSRQREIYFIQL